MSKAQIIKAEARRLGFFLAGITTPDKPPHFEVYKSWLEQGRHAEMSYLASERALNHRASLSEVFPPVKSVLVLGIPYPSPTTYRFLEGGPTRGRIASYAWGLDYHTIIPLRLTSLGKFIEASFGPGTLSKGFTDTAPILERDLAQRAGLGWIGKNTCLINPKSGSYFLLSELMTNIELEPDLPFAADRCGNCTRCIEACPTRCILPDRTLDAGRCISYLTIEKKGSIPTELRPLMDKWVFGCDICQMVCPWNTRFAFDKGDDSFVVRPDVPFPDLLKELEMTPHSFNVKFRNNPVQRCHRRGYLRNICISLGNAHEAAAIPYLANVLTDEPEPIVRGSAAWALHQIGGDAAAQALAKSPGSETDPDVQDEISG